jgi:hypothetical protein
MLSASGVPVATQIHLSPHGVQAEVNDASLFIMSHEVDMQNPICWLERNTAAATAGRHLFVVPSIHVDVNPIRQVLLPFNMTFTQRASRPDVQPRAEGLEPVRYSNSQARPTLHACASQQRQGSEAARELQKETMKQ